MSSNFRELLDHARNKRIAIGAFNVFNYVSTKASIQVANELNMPILLQTSVNTVRKFGAQNLFQMMDLLRRQSLVPILFHLDHCTDPSLAKECIDVGWDSVMIDISAKPIEMNIAITSEIKRYAQKKGICVEGELGIISGVEDELSAEAETQAEYHSCMKFLSETDIDAFAPSIGTAHGMYTKEVKLNYQLVKRLAENTKVPIVVHGGTGLSKDQFHRLIECGASKINVSTALKHAYINGIKTYMEEGSQKFNPLELDEAAEAAIRKVVAEHIRWFTPNPEVLRNHKQ